MFAIRMDCLYPWPHDPATRTAFWSLALLLGAWIANLLTQRILLRAVRAQVQASPTRFDEALFAQGVLDRLAHEIPALVVHQGIVWIPGIATDVETGQVQNWDKTITTAPTWRLIGESFRNWRGMSKSGGRRIKRALPVDLSSIRFPLLAIAGRFGLRRCQNPSSADLQSLANMLAEHAQMPEHSATGA